MRDKPSRYRIRRDTKLHVNDPAVRLTRWLTGAKNQDFSIKIEGGLGSDFVMMLSRHGREAATASCSHSLGYKYIYMYIAYTRSINSSTKTYATQELCVCVTNAWRRGELNSSGDQPEVG